MKKNIAILFIIIPLFTLNFFGQDLFITFENVTPSPCKFDGEKEYEFIQVEKKITRYNSKKPFSELQFCCVGSSLSIKKVLFDTYGIWDKVYYTDGVKEPNLIWKNVIIEGEKVSVIATGVDDHHIYTSLIIIDSNWNDFIARNEKAFDATVSYFDTLLRQNNWNDNTFMKKYVKKYSSFKFRDY